MNQFKGYLIRFLCRGRYAGGQETEKAESFQNEEKGILYLFAFCIKYIASTMSCCLPVHFPYINYLIVIQLAIHNFC